MPLTAQQQAFVDEYALDMDQKAAALRAGYSPTGIHQCASRLMHLPHVAEAIRARMREIFLASGLTVEELANRLAHEARDLDAPKAERMKALELAMKHHGMLREKIDFRNENPLEHLTDSQLAALEKVAAMKEAARAREKQDFCLDSGIPSSFPVE